MFFFPMVIRGLRLAGIAKLKYDRKNKWIRVIKTDAIRSLPINNSDNNSSSFALSSPREIQQVWTKGKKRGTKLVALEHISSRMHSFIFFFSRKKEVFI